MAYTKEKAIVAGRCNALQQARQTLVHTVAMANKPKSVFNFTPQQEAELQACAVIISRIESSLWSRWNELDRQI